MHPERLSQCVNVFWDGCGRGREMRKPSEEFKVAILRSLEDLLKKGGKFTRAQVISRALLPSGLPVGRSTLYRKDKAGAFVYADLLKKLDASVAPRPVAKEKPVSSDESERVALRLENANLVDRVVTLERELVVLASRVRRGEASVRLLEIEKYVLARLLCDLEPGLILGRQAISEFELKFAGRMEMGDAEKILKGWIRSSA